MARPSMFAHGTTMKRYFEMRSRSAGLARPRKSAPVSSSWIRFIAPATHSGSAPWMPATKRNVCFAGGGFPM